MPHCNRGHELHVGDIVMIECEVTDVQEGIDYCNVTVRTVRPMPPYKSGTTIVLNTKQTEKVISRSYNDEILDTD